MSTSSTKSGVGDQTVDLSRYARIALRWWPVALVGLLLGALAGLGLSAATPSRYSSQSVVQVLPGAIYTLDASANSTPNMDTEQQIALSTVVTNKALAAVQGALSVAEFQHRSTATSPKKSATMNLGFIGDSPLQSKQGADALASAYLAHRTEQAQSDIDQARKQVTESSKALGARLGKAQVAAADAKAGTAEAARRDDQVKLLTDQLAPVRGQLDRLTSVVINPGVQVGTAQAPSSPDGTPKFVYVVVGGFVGLVGALLLIIIVTAVRDRLGDRADVERAFGVPVWGETQPDDRVLKQDAVDALVARIQVLRRSSHLASLAIVSVDSDVVQMCADISAILQRTGVDAAITVGAVGAKAQPPEISILPAGRLKIDQRAAALAALCDSSLLITTRANTAKDTRSALVSLGRAGAHVGGVFLDRRKRVGQDELVDEPTFVSSGINTDGFGSGAESRTMEESKP